MTPEEQNGYMLHFAYRVLQDALNEATESYWTRRAQMFEWTKPRLDDFRGQATSTELSERWQRADRIARMCRHRASLATETDEYAEETWAVFREAWEAA